jgi:hypothetical protein
VDAMLLATLLLNMVAFTFPQLDGEENDTGMILDL